jgi:hypothetical protein
MRDGDQDRNVPLLHIGRHDNTWENVEADPSASPAQKVAVVLSRLVDRASEALANASEAGLSDGLEAACRNLADVLGELAVQIPSTSEQCQQLSSDLCEVSGDQDSDAAFSEAPPPEETLRLARAVKAALADAQQCLAEVPRAEIEELAGAALAASQVAVTAARSAVRRLQLVADREAAGSSSVVIEDLGVDGVSDNLGGVDSGDCVVVVHRRRLLWKPLWPRLRGWVAQPTLPPSLTVWLSHFAAWIMTYKVPLLVGCFFSWPVWICVALWIILAALVLMCVLTVILPCTLLADAGMQHVYAGWRTQVDDLAEGGLRLAKLVYLSTRLTFRQCLRVVRIQLKRALNGRGVSDAMQDGLRDPLGSLTTFARFWVRLISEVTGIVYATCLSLAPLLRRCCTSS